jgi:hypothetical protein
MEIPGLGLFKNGSTRLVTPDEAAAFRSFHTRPVVDEEAEPADNGQPVYKEELGPTPLQAMEKSEWIVVEPVEMTQDKDGKWEKKGASKPPPSPTDPTPTTNEGGDQ